MLEMIGVAYLGSCWTVVAKKKEKTILLSHHTAPVLLSSFTCALIFLLHLKRAICVNNKLKFSIRLGKFYTQAREMLQTAYENEAFRLRHTSGGNVFKDEQTSDDDHENAHSGQL